MEPDPVSGTAGRCDSCWLLGLGALLREAPGGDTSTNVRISSQFRSAMVRQSSDFDSVDHDAEVTIIRHPE